MHISPPDARLVLIREAIAWLSQVWGFRGVAAGNATILEAGNLVRRLGPEGK